MTATTAAEPPRSRHHRSLPGPRTNFPSLGGWRQPSASSTPGTWRWPALGPDGLPQPGRANPDRLARGRRPIHTLNAWLLLQNATPQVVAGRPGRSGKSKSLEARFGEAVTRSLGERGHAVESIGDWATGGATQRIRVEDGMLTGGGDPRPGTSSVIGY